MLETNSLATAISCAEVSLISKLSGIEDVRHLTSIQRYANTYIRLIREEYIKIDDSLVTILTDGQRQRLTVRSMERFFDFLSALVEAIQNYNRDTTLSVVHGSLIELGVPSSEADHYKAYQLIFIGIGLVTMLFRASMNSAEKEIQLSGTQVSPQANRDRTWNKGSLVLDEDRTELVTLDDLLYQLAAQPDGPIPRPYPPNRGAGENLASSNLSYYTLSALASLRIEWVDSACQHLE